MMSFYTFGVDARQVDLQNGKMAEQGDYDVYGRSTTSQSPTEP
jgi:hypothetical protein